MDDITHRRVLKIALPIVLSNATVPLLGAVDTGVVGQMGRGGTDRGRWRRRSDPGRDLLGLRLSQDGHVRPRRPGPWCEGPGGNRRDPDAGVDDRLCRRLRLPDPASTVVPRRLLACACLRRGRDADAELPDHPHLGGARDHRAFRRHRLVDRRRTDAERSGPATLDERAEYRARSPFRPRLRLGRGRRGHRHPDRGMGPGWRSASGCAARPLRVDNGATGRGSSTGRASRG